MSELQPLPQPGLVGLVVHHHVQLLRATWRPLLAGAVGAVAAMGAVRGMLPGASPREAVTQSPRETLTVLEQNFVNRPEYLATAYHGRIQHAEDGVSLIFDNGLRLVGARWDAASARGVADPALALDVGKFEGDLAYCPQSPSDHLFYCHALHAGVETLIPYKSRTP